MSKGKLLCESISTGLKTGCFEKRSQPTAPDAQRFSVNGRGCREVYPFSVFKYTTRIRNHSLSRSVSHNVKYYPEIQVDLERMVGSGRESIFLK